MSRTIIRLPLIAAAIVTVAGACTREWDVTNEPGEPLPGLTAEELERFETGKAGFTRVWWPEEGLGPLYTENSCNACHHDPQTGGSSQLFDIHASRFIEPDSCDTMRFERGFVRRNVTPLMVAAGGDRETPPTDATGTSRFTVPPLFGLGLVEAIPEETILALADPEDLDGDGISGRASRLADGRLGRFRRKLDRAAIRDLAEAGAWFALGLTTPDHPEEVPYMGRPVPPAADPTPEPEVAREALDQIAEFIRLLAPPRPAPPRDAADREIIVRGGALFAVVGCADCHVPALRTGPNAIAALDRKLVPLYSDLLLHDMGPELADVCGPTATPSEVRTQMLWGVRYRSRLMHDGRARSLRESIEMHGGESAASRAAFDQLDPASQQAVIRFTQTR
ncbi:MAG: hypothetical protein JSW43_06410 [Gemmatimonadota bacterium]|nr:MAG: hypothetical protein JSW43_06410 [Gemmatimonadota bacterium]